VAQRIAERNSEQVVASQSSFSGQVLPLAVEAEGAGDAVVGSSGYNEGE
jgi:hypothetical protein